MTTRSGKIFARDGDGDGNEDDENIEDEVEYFNSEYFELDPKETIESISYIISKEIPDQSPEVINKVVETIVMFGKDEMSSFMGIKPSDVSWKIGLSDED